MFFVEAKEITVYIGQRWLFEALFPLDSVSELPFAFAYKQWLPLFQHGPFELPLSTDTSCQARNQSSV